MARNDYLIYHVQILYFCNNDIISEVFNTIRICIHLKSDIRISLTLPYTIQLYMPDHCTTTLFSFDELQYNVTSLHLYFQKYAFQDFLKVWIQKLKYIHISIPLQLFRLRLLGLLRFSENFLVSNTLKPIYFTPIPFIPVKVREHQLSF